MQDNEQARMEQHKTTHARAAENGAQQNSRAHSTSRHAPNTAIQSIAERSDAQTHSAAQRNIHYSSTKRRNAQAHRAGGDEHMR